MDRRQRKTREAIFGALVQLLSRKEFSEITVGEIIERADVGRATFYAHFETKDFLLKELCEDLFCHVFDAAEHPVVCHNHIFHCDAPESVFLHLFQHFMQNDNHILTLLSCPSNDLFLRYFKEQLRKMVTEQRNLFAEKKNPKLPDGLWIDHIASVFVDMIRWWVDHGMKESPETMAEYFDLII